MADNDKNKTANEQSFESDLENSENTEENTLVKIHCLIIQKNKRTFPGGSLL